MTPTGLTKDAGWEIGASRTVPAPLEEVWELLLAGPGLTAWLGEGATLPAALGEPYTATDGTTGELRSLRPHDRVRLTLQPPGRTGRPTTVQVALRPTATGTSIRFHQEHLADADERAQQRAHWHGVLDRIEDLLADGGASSTG